MFEPSNKKEKIKFYVNKIFFPRFHRQKQMNTMFKLYDI